MTSTKLPPIPAKRYFTIGEVGDLCGVKPHVLRYWEQEFSQLRPMKRRGNRRYYQHNEVLMVRRIRELLYEQGFTISGARNKLQETVAASHGDSAVELIQAADIAEPAGGSAMHSFSLDTTSLVTELRIIRRLLASDDRSEGGSAP